MAAATTDSPLSGLNNGPGLDSELLQAFAVGLGMDPLSQHELQRPDVNYLQEVAKLPVDFSKVPSGTDVRGMRRWLDEVYLSPGFAEARSKCNIQRRRPQQKVNKTVVSVKPSDNSDETFDLWIYQTDSKLEKGKPAILMFHGGGWIHGNPLGDEVVAEIFASELDVVAVGVDYRLAPEHPFPTPVNDCADALEWISHHADTHNIDINRIGLWGASAGANLAAALALKHSQEQAALPEGVSISLVSLTAPVTGHPKAISRFVEHRKLPKSHNEALFEGEKPPSEQAIKEVEDLYGSALYIGDGGDPYDPLVSPILAQPTSAHPATHITVAACDLLKEQGLAYGEVLRAGGVHVTEEILPGVPHAFTYSMSANVAERWVEREVERFGRAFGLLQE